MRLAKAETASGFQHTVDLDYRFLEAGMCMVQATHHDNVIEGCVLEPKIGHRGSHRCALWKPPPEQLDLRVRDIEADDEGASAQQLPCDLTAAAHGFEHARAGEIDAAKQQWIDEPVSIAPARLVVVVGLVVRRHQEADRSPGIVRFLGELLGFLRIARAVTGDAFRRVPGRALGKDRSLGIPQVLGAEAV